MGAFAIGAMGGGDVKLIAALGLWLVPPDFMRMIVWMSIGGGVLTLAHDDLRTASASRRAHSRFPTASRSRSRPIPELTQRYLYHFGR